MAFGALISGDLISRTNVQVVLMGSGLILTAIALWFLLVQRRVAEL